MKRLFRLASPLILGLMLAACGKDSPVPDDGGGSGGGGGGGDEPKPAVSYWEDSTARKGLQADRIGVTDVAIFLGSAKYYATGVNCYNLFGSAIRSGFTFDPADSFEALDILHEQGVGVVRFNCGIFYSRELPAYLSHRDEFISTLKQIAAYAEKLHIGLIPSFVWNYAAIPGYFGEPYRCWGRDDSQTVNFLKTYTQDVVTALHGYKSIFGWEYGNEFNLQADLPNWQDIFGTKDENYWIKGSDVASAYRVFASTVAANDPDGRMILTGNSVMRNSQYNQYANNSWTTDDTQQYKEITGILNPGRINTVSEHVYEQGRSFADLGSVSLKKQLSLAMNFSRQLSKAYVIGEFAGVLSSEEAYRVYYDAFLEAGVQLSLVWNFALHGDIEHSFTADETRGQYIFALIREYNGKYGQKYK